MENTSATAADTGAPPVPRLAHPDRVVPLRVEPRSPEPTPLFRTEAIEARERHTLGEILLTQASSGHWGWTVAAIAIACGIVAFLAFGEYTRKERVAGRLVLSHQSVKQYAPSVGTVAKRLVAEGATIRRGDPLFRIDVDRVIGDRVDAQREILRGIGMRRANLLNEQALTQRILSEDAANVKTRLDRQREQLGQIEGELAAQERRVALNSENLERTRKLFSQEIVSATEAREKEQEHLTLRAQLDALRRSRTALQQDIGTSESELRNAPLKARTQLSALERSVRELEQQAVDSESRRELLVVALTDGHVTGVLVDVGQQVTPTTPLLSILPSGAELQAQLYVPTRAIGFLQQDGPVLLRYQAFPYQKFGQHSGRVRSISRTTFSPGELQLVGDAKEQYYRVLVGLEHQRVMAYGRPTPLHDGMDLEADLPVDSRRLYEWILEPLYSLTGRY